MRNRLNGETSPYLLQHAENPVDWFPWGNEAFAAAKEQDKPIFLSIGYSACHWCHVMAHESFEDPVVAERLNQDFINIKVDREERPDIDSIYMDAVVAMTGQGGWPMSVFLTPDLKPFFGGTYFPPVRRFNMPSFTEVLDNILQAWRQDRDALEETGNRLTRHIDSAPGLGGDGKPLEAGILQQAADRLHQTFDWEHGGWGRAPKFPLPLVLNFLLRKYLRDRDLLALDMAKLTLQKMARGGMHDQLAGGFARYSVDDQWLVPHFEKMLYDNAQLATTYLRAWQVTADPEFLQVVHSTLGFLIRELQHDEGGFFSSLDADSEGVEGKYYVWRVEEIRSLLDPGSAKVFLDAYGVTEHGNFESANILFQDLEVGELAGGSDLTEQEIIESLEVSRSTLLAARQTRVPPGLDDKVLTAWNGLTLTAFAEASRATGRAEYAKTAQAIAAFALDQLIVEGRLKRSWRDGQAKVNGFLSDHAALAEGLVSLYQLDFNPEWLEAAIQLADAILELFDDPHGGFFNTPPDQGDLIARPKTIQDSPLASGNALAASVFLKLSSLTGIGKYTDKVEASLKDMQANASQHPTAFAEWLNAIDYGLGPQLQLALIGRKEQPDFQRLLEVANETYRPNLVVAAGQAEDFPALLSGRTSEGGSPTAYLCQNFTCNLPTQSPEALRDQLGKTREDFAGAAPLD